MCLLIAKTITVYNGSVRGCSCDATAETETTVEGVVREETAGAHEGSVRPR